MSEVKRVIVFGANGITGKAILHRSLQEGLQVTAFVRKPNKLPEDLRSKIKIEQGDVFDKERVKEAIKGHDAVMSALGTGWSFAATTLMSEGCKNIVEGMKANQVRKLAVVGMVSCFPGQWRPGFFEPLRRDHSRQIEVLQKEKEHIDWVAVMPPQLWNSNKINPGYLVALNDLPGSIIVNTGEVADFMVKCFVDKSTSERYRHCQLGISSRPAFKFSTPWKILTVSGIVILCSIVLYYIKQ